MIFIHASCDQPLMNSPITKLSFVIPNLVWGISKLIKRCLTCVRHDTDMEYLSSAPVVAGAASPYILRQSLTLRLLSYIYFVVFLYVLFGRKKNEKRPAHGFRKSFTPRLGNSTNIPRLSLSCRLCLPFQSREQKNSLHALPASYGTHAQTLLFLFLNWNWHALLLKRCRFSFWHYYCSRFSTSIGDF